VHGLHIRSGRSGWMALSTAAPLARSPFRPAAFAIGRGPRVIGRVLAANLLTALDVATLHVICTPQRGQRRSSAKSDSNGEVA